MDIATQTVHRLRTAINDLAWSLWSELGVSSWTPSRHASWGIELEPLIVLTGSLPEIDVRRRNEVIDWCVSNDRFISLAQLRRSIAHLHGGQRPAELSTFTATVSQLGRRRWPLAADGEGLHITLSGKSAPPQLASPALYQLRLRAIFGVSARAEILRVLSREPHELTVTQIADRAATRSGRWLWTPRCSPAAASSTGRGAPAPPGTRSVDPSSLAAFVGERPAFFPRWTEPFTTLFHLMGAFQKVAAAELNAPDVELWRWLRRADECTAGLRIPQDLWRRPSLEGLAAWGVVAADHLATGDAAAYERGLGASGP